MKTVDSSFYFELDPYEQALEDELERLDQEGLLVVRPLTLEEKNTCRQTAANTLKALHEGKRWMVERRSKYANSSEELMSWFSPAAQEKLKQELKKKKISSQEKQTPLSLARSSILSLSPA